MRLSLSLCLLVLAGCTTSREASEARGYERGYQQAVKEQYWIIQNQQRESVNSPAADNPHP